MHKLILLVLAFIAAEAVGQRFILPTYRPPRTRSPPIIRMRREDSEPQWLYKGDAPRAPSSGDHPLIPNLIDDVRLDPDRRYARSLDSPSAKRGGGARGGHSSGNRDTGATHPGYNRRNARSLQIPQPIPLNPFRRPPIYEPRRPPVTPMRPIPIYV
ncbi:lebocin-1/2-like [Aricia agestis]|uniref:lebocin-1/2-like n=1 Tax=Aricia agestis TaxID=91739 RepID=UPI001C204AD3|nr:lebocin-1/2-like [Aricia agestis]